MTTTDLTIREDQTFWDNRQIASGLLDGLIVELAQIEGGQSE